MTTYDLVASCPFCAKRFDAATSVDDKDQRGPVNGDISLCFGCGEWLVFDSESTTGMRSPIHTEYVNIVADDTCTAARTAWLKLIESIQK